ncbi:MAG: hypothetical protein EAY70_03290 [Sphingomonadales bacterium]|nr:MAG: hypothetical protein EAY70_03290 [Sphingomonadales bacterium]
MAGNSAFAQVPQPTTDEITNLVFRLFDSIKRADYDQASDLFADGFIGMGGCDRPFPTRDAAISYLRSMPFRETHRTMSWDVPIVVDDLLVCAVWKERYPNSQMPITGKSWLLVFELEASERSLLVGRLNVIERD